MQAVARGGFDGILLDSHGAMVSQSHEDGEGELLRRIRAIDPKTPIGVAYDMHANVYADMVELAQTVAGYQTYPHVDMYGTGVRAGTALLKLLQGQAKPTTAWGRLPMIPHIMRQSSLDEPNRSIQARAQQMEKEGALCASVFTGFPHADIENAGMSVVVVTDNDPALAQRLRDELMQMAWDSRAQWVYELEPLAASVARAKTLTEYPVMLLDHYDNAASGGTMDTMTVLGAMLDAGLTDAAACAIFDPAAVQQMAAAGVGSTITLSLGGKLDMPGIGLKGVPRTVTGRVRLLCDGRYRNRGPMSRGELNDMGPTAVLQVAGIDIVVISNHVEPNDMAAMTAVGIAPDRLRYVMLKSRIHWRAGLRHLSHATVECNGTGVCSSDYALLGLHRCAGRSIRSTRCEWVGWAHCGSCRLATLGARPRPSGTWPTPCHSGPAALPPLPTSARHPTPSSSHHLRTRRIAWWWLSDGPGGPALRK